MTRRDGMLDDGSIAAIFQSIGTTMRRARLAEDWKLADVAERCGISQSVLCRMELSRREPRLRLLLVQCAVTGVQPSEVLGLAQAEAFPLGRSPWPEAGRLAELLARQPGVGYPHDRQPGRWQS